MPDWIIRWAGLLSSQARVTPSFSQKIRVVSLASDLAGLDAGWKRSKSLKNKPTDFNVIIENLRTHSR